MKQKFNTRSLKTFVATIAVAGTAMTPLSAAPAAADGTPSPAMALTPTPTPRP